MATPYNVGTITVDNGATSVAGTDTYWVGKVRQNDMLFIPAQGLMARVTADPTDNEVIAITAWAGTGLTDAAYEIIPAADSTTNTARLRDLLAQMSVVQANNQGVFYRFSDTTSDADPGSGYFRLNNADPALATAIYIDNINANGGSMGAIIDTWDGGTSLVKGTLIAQGVTDRTIIRAYSITGAVVDGTGYRKLTATYDGGSGSLSADDEFMLAFVPKGDAGEGYVTDATVAAPADLTALEGEAAGYLVFVADLETDFGAYSGRSGVVRLIAGPAWELVALYTGLKGDTGATGATGATGPIGVDWKGAYSGATAYAANDGVLYNGSSWIALGATTGNAPPTLPATSNTWWELLARQGTDGSGTVASIVAGANVAVDNTDPTAPVVSLAPVQAWLEGAAIASASTLVLGTDGNFFHVTGTTTITAISGDASPVFLVFDGAVTLTHNATSLILPGNVNTKAAAGDKAIFVDEGSGNWRCISFERQASIVAEDIIYTGAISSLSTFDLANLSAYRTIRVTGRFRPTTDSVLLLLRTSSNNGSSYDSGASDYAYQLLRGTGASVSVDTDEDYLAVLVSPTSVGNVSNEGVFFDFTMSEFNQASEMYLTGTAHMKDASANMMTATIGGRRNQATARDALRLFFASGNIDAGHITVRGVRG